MKLYSVIVCGIIQLDVLVDSEDQILPQTLNNLDEINEALQQQGDLMNHLQIFTSGIDNSDITYTAVDENDKLKELILDLLEEKRLGNDCTEAESAEIKHFIRTSSDQSILNEIQELFPCEWNESAEETEL